MMAVWGQHPKCHQHTVIPYLVQMMNKTIPPQAILLVQSTRSGKSVVSQTATIMNKGVTIIIENTLAISSDQISKMQQKLMGINYYFFN
jgi:superfamily II DNA helicase RecQ